MAYGSKENETLDEKKVIRKFMKFINAEKATAHNTSNPLHLLKCDCPARTGLLSYCAESTCAVTKFLDALLSHHYTFTVVNFASLLLLYVIAGDRNTVRTMICCSMS